MGCRQRPGGRAPQRDAHWEARRRHLEARALAAEAAGDAAEWAYLDRAALRSLGSVPSRLFGRVTTADWSTAFDAVLVIRDEAAPTFEPRR